MYKKSFVRRLSARRWQTLAWHSWPPACGGLAIELRTRWFARKHKIMHPAPIQYTTALHRYSIVLLLIFRIYIRNQLSVDFFSLVLFSSGSVDGTVHGCCCCWCRACPTCRSFLVMISAVCLCWKTSGSRSVVCHRPPSNHSQIITNKQQRF